MTVGLLFDNDGVLIDSSELHWYSWELLMREDPSFVMEHEQFVRGFGKRNDLILQDVQLKASQEQKEKWAVRKEELFREYAKERITLIPGIEAFLQEVARAKIPRIIASSTPIANLKMFLKCTPLGQYFDRFVSAEQVAHGKPFPDVFLEAARVLNMPPERCIVFEDAPAGVTAGKKAGSFVVALGTTHAGQELTEADLFYPSPHALRLPEILNAHQQWLS